MTVTIDDDYTVNIPNLLNMIINQLSHVTAGSVIKELITNEKDAKSKRYMVKWEPTSALLSVEGWGTGIKDLMKFKEIATDCKLIEKLKDPNSDITGEKGIGRFSTLKLCDEVIFLNSTKGQGAKITFKRNDKPRIILGSEFDYLVHNGVKVIMPNIKKEYHADIANVDKDIAETFAYALMLHAPNDIDIYFNDKRILAPASYQKAYQENDYQVNSYPPTDYAVVGGIEGILKKDPKADTGGIVTMFQNGIKVTDKKIPFKAKGFLNFGNKIKLMANRNDYQLDFAGLQLDLTIQKIMIDQKFEPVDAIHKFHEKVNKRTQQFNEFAGSFFGNTLGEWYGKVDAKLRGALQNTGQTQLGANKTVIENEKRFFLANEGSPFDTAIQGVEGWKKQKGEISEEGTLAGGAVPKGTGGNGLNRVDITDDPSDPDILVKEILEGTGPLASVFNVNQIERPVKKIINAEAKLKNKTTNNQKKSYGPPTMQIVHTELINEKIFMKYSGSKERPVMYINRRNQLWEEIFIGKAGNIRRLKYREFGQFIAYTLVESFPLGNTIVEKHIEANRILYNFWESARKKGVIF